MQDPSTQTAIQGVATATILNLFSKLLNYIRHIVIAAYIGLSVELDAFYVATSVVAIFINTFGDIFDSVGIPILVKTRTREGEESFRRLTGSIFTFAVKLGATLCLFMILCFPLAPRLVPGFRAESRGFIYENLIFLIPYALAYLPYHCLGSFFRSVRRFYVFSAVEFLVQAIALLVLFQLRASERAVPLSLSAGYLIGLGFFVFWGQRHFRVFGDGKEPHMAEVRRTLLDLLPLYLLGHGFVIIDRYFASFLEPGAISALFYGYVLAMSVPLIMNIDFVFVTPLSEESNRGELLTRILSGVLLVSLPMLAFGLLFADDIVRMLFERGAFDARSTRLTADALRFYLIGLPAFFIWPVCIRTFQISKIFRRLAAIAFVALILNGILNYLFVVKSGLGVKGISLATSLSWSFGALYGLWFLSARGIRIRCTEALMVLPNIFVGVAIALSAAVFLPPVFFLRLDVIVRGIAFVAIYAITVVLIPGSEMRRIQALVLESFPWLAKRVAGWL